MDLFTLNKQVKGMVESYIATKQITLNKFAKLSGVHQNQLWMYLNATEQGKGLHSTTLEKIGKFLLENQ